MAAGPGGSVCLCGNNVQGTASVKKKSSHISACLEFHGELEDSSRIPLVLFPLELTPPGCPSLSPSAASLVLEGDFGACFGSRFMRPSVDGPASPSAAFEMPGKCNV